MAYKGCGTNTVCFHFYFIHFFTIHRELATFCINERLKTEVYFIQASSLYIDI